MSWDVKFNKKWFEYYLKPFFINPLTAGYLSPTTKCKDWKLYFASFVYQKINHVILQVMNNKMVVSMKADTDFFPTDFSLLHENEYNLDM